MGASEEEIAQKALASPGVKKHIEGKPIVKTIYAQGRLLNVVVK